MLLPFSGLDVEVAGSSGAFSGLTEGPCSLIAVMVGLLGSPLEPPVASQNTICLAGSS